MGLTKLGYFPYPSIRSLDNIVDHFQTCPTSSYFADLTARHDLLSSTHQVICEKVEKSDISDIDKKKYLVPAVSSTFLPFSQTFSRLRIIPLIRTR
jgi:hypothetical protein